MLFNSLEFILFLPAVIILYYVIPHKFRWVLLLIASYFFYMYWNPYYIVLIVLSTAVDYIAGIYIEKYEEKKKKRLFLFASLFINLGLLFFFKYFNFFNGAVASLYHQLTSGTYPVNSLNLLLPVGISFYTFQTLSYTIDIYRGKRKAEKHLGYFALYVCYFPQLVAGPIERSERLIPQLKEKHKVEYNRIVSGLLRIAFGFFKKVIIADGVAIIVNTVYGDLYSFRGAYLIFATTLFLIQIYCDFSAYADIAIGSAKLMGIDLIENFNLPFFAKSINDFWSRWHISLTTWLKDYIYIPLGGSRGKKTWLNYRNIMIIFLISGLWHGAEWTFIIWGAFHGALSVLERMFSDLKNKISFKLPTIPLILKQILTFGLVSFSMLFFRAKDISDAVYIIRKMPVNNFFLFFSSPSTVMGIESKELFLLIISIVILFIIEGIKFYRKKTRLINKDNWQLVAFVLLVVVIVVFGFYGQYEALDFIYFQF